MSKFFKRAAVIAVALAMLLSLVVFQGGCAKKDVKQAESTTGTSTAGTQSEQTAVTQNEPPVELTILGPNVAVGIQQGVQTDPIAKEIEKQTGVTMNIIPTNAVGDINSKIAAMLATGDLPDITYFPALDLMQSAVTAKALLPLDDYLDKNGQNLLKNAPAMLDYSRQHLSVDRNAKTDNKLYYITNPVGIYNYDPYKSAVGIYLRWDLYKKLGYPKVESLDDYIPILKKMMELEPTNADGKKNYGTAAWFADAQWWGDWLIWGGIPGLYGDGCGTYATATNVVSGDYLPWLTDTNSNFFRAVKWLNKANREKILDPDSFTMKWDNYEEKIKAGRVFMGYAGWGFDPINKDYLAKGVKDKYYVQMPPPKDSTAYWFSVDLPNGIGTVGYAVSKNCKYPEKAVKFIDFLASYDGIRLLCNGIKGQSWDEVDGKAVLKKEMIDQNNNDKDFALKTGIGKYENMSVMSYMNTDPKYSGFLKFFFQPDVLATRLTPVEKEQCDYYGVKMPTELITKNVKTTIGYDTANNSIPALPKDLQDMSNKLDKYVFDNYIKMILANSDEQFAAEQTKFIERVKSLGYEKLEQWYKDERAKVWANKK